MRITISAHLRRRGLRMATLLARRHQVKLISGYPGPMLRRIEPDYSGQLVTWPALAAVAPTALGRLGFAGLSQRTSFQFNQAYDWMGGFAMEGADVVHCWSSWFLRGLRRAKRSGAITVVDRASTHIEVTERILREAHEALGQPGKVIDPRVIDKELREYEEADYISIPSRFVKRTFLEQGVPERKLIQIPYGVDLDEFRPVDKRDDVFRVVHCGAISARKGVHFLVQAFEALNLPNSELYLVGPLDAAFEPTLRRLAGPRVKLAGSKPQNELYQHYSQGSVFCLASVEDGFGLVIPQAMSCGLPAICSDTTGGPDIVREGQDGMIFPSGDVEALKEKLQFCYEHPDLLAEMGRNASERVNRDFTWEKYCDRMEVAYERIVGGEHPAGRATEGG